MVELYKGDCLEVMKTIEDKSIDAIITDPPYGTTACKWDSVIDFDLMWKQLNRIIKPNGAIVLFGSEPFSSALRMSNIKNYKYDWIWEKTRPSRYVQAKKMPLSYKEVISVFYKSLPTYNPQMTVGKPYKKNHKNTTKPNSYGEEKRNGTTTINKGIRYPSDIIKISNANGKSVHPTQKPIALMEYLIKTYTNENETVLDFTMGSGTTMVACDNLNRNGIGIEMDDNYFNIAKKRIEDNKLKLF